MTDTWTSHNSSGNMNGVRSNALLKNDDDENDEEFGRFEDGSSLTANIHQAPPSSTHHRAVTGTTSKTEMPATNSSVDSTFDPEQRQVTMSRNDDPDSPNLGGNETRAVSCLRLMVLAVLVVSATCTAIAVYFYTRNSELRLFESEFYADAEKIIHSVSNSIHVTLGTIDAYASFVVQVAHDSNQQFPFVTIPFAHIQMDKLASIGRTVMMQQAHFVSSEQRTEWENYASNNSQWIYDSLQEQETQNASTSGIEKMIHNYNGTSTNTGPYLPTWQSQHIIPGWSMYNFDALTYTTVIESYDALFSSRHAIISPPTFVNETNNIPTTFGNSGLYQVASNHSFVTSSRYDEPVNVIFYPMIDTASVLTDADNVTGDDSYPVVGILSAYFYWTDLIQGTIPESGGIYCVIEDTCNHTVTYKVSGSSVRFLGLGDFHDPAFSHMVQSFTLSEISNFATHNSTYSVLPLGDDNCPYSMNIYPSAEDEATHKSSNPAIFTVCAVLIFLFTSAVFLMYDLCVERRQQKVMNTAIQSSENVSLLESMVKERTRKLEETNRSLARANLRVTRASAAQLEHFACMSHEIRTPLNCIIGLSSLLLDTELNAMQEESIRMIVTSGDLLLTVVNDVLDYSKLESGNVELSITLSNLQDTLSAVVQSIEARARPKMLSIRTKYDPRICEYGQMDCRRLQQILYNLLGNALKFSNAGGTIDLTIFLKDAIEGNSLRPNGHTYTPKADDHEIVRAKSIVVFEDMSGDMRGSAASRRSSTKFKLLYDQSNANVASNALPKPFQHYICYVVKDCGKGIERKDFQKIFEPFRQASAETERVYGGTGLGLAVTAKLVTALGGTVSVDSCEGEWTEFTVQLPYHDAPFRIDLAAQKLVDTVVLLVDNDPANILALSTLFQECGINNVYYSCMEDILNAAAASGFMKSRNTFICLVNELLFDLSAYNRLTAQARLLLLTFGPKFSVKETKYHYSSLTQMLPSVLLTSFSTLVDSLNNVEDASPIQMDSPQPSATTQTVLRRSFTMRDIRIMMAEDNKINQKVLMRILNRLGYTNIEVVENGKEACDLEETQYYDIILMDVQMPVMNGIEACHHIMTRKTTNHPKPRIVFVTAHVSDAFESECRSAGGADFLPKPFNISDIENCLLRNMPAMS